MPINEAKKAEKHLFRFYRKSFIKLLSLLTSSPLTQNLKKAINVVGLWDCMYSYLHFLLRKIF